jgi:hypothetical protein
MTTAQKQDRSMKASTRNARFQRRTAAMRLNNGYIRAIVGALIQIKPLAGGNRCRQAEQSAYLYILIGKSGRVIALFDHIGEPCAEHPIEVALQHRREAAPPQRRDQCRLGLLFGHEICR